MPFLTLLRHCAASYLLQNLCFATYRSTSAQTTDANMFGTAANKFAYSVLTVHIDM